MLSENRKNIKFPFPLLLDRTRRYLAAFVWQCFRFSCFFFHKLQRSDNGGVGFPERGG